MKIKKTSILLVVYTNGRAWFHVKKGRNFNSLMYYFRNKANFKYAKIFYKDKYSKTVNSQYGYFNNRSFEFLP